MNSETMVRVVSDFFAEDAEVHEVALYVLSTLVVSDAVLQGIMGGKTEVRGIPPEAIHTMRKYDNNLTMNKFWLANYGPIKSQLAMADIKLQSMADYIGYGESEGDVNAFNQARAILLSRFDTLTMVALTWKGYEFAQEFDSKVRISVQLSPQHKKYYQGKCD